MSERPSLRRASSRLSDTLRTELWPVPTIGVLLAVIVGVVFPQLEAGAQGGKSEEVSTYLFGGGPDAARTVLSAIAGSLITVTALTFSLTVLTLQLASSQFSPRLLRTFSRDRFVHVTLAIFLSTFTFALAVLRSVRTGGDNDDDAFVPRVSVSLALLLTLASVFALVFFLAHLAREIRVETMLVNVHKEARGTVDRLLPERFEAALPPLPDPPEQTRLLVAPRSGFLTYVDEPALLEAAVATDAVLHVELLPGSSLVAGSPLGRAWSLDRSAVSKDVGDRLQEAIDASISSGTERTATQDVAYGLRQLTDVATKALSPGINDPTTALHALGHSSALLCQAVRREHGPRVLHDEDGQVRVVLRRPGMDELLDLAIGQPRRYGAADPAVLGRLANLLRELAWAGADTHDQRAVADQLGRLRRTAGLQDFDPAENASLEALFALVDAALAGSWPA